ncbi:hypothetical protein [Microcystis aeruginosa]|uniref:hypothetical protein n=1 Tax=Microcystis aeruginosa TaxID=1126 RepID=UPI00233049D9|nr:hypothetical protein [Microcystis aeruginosa]MDB9411982.1 hypothetical protein [Microcystis aeruginosa CS-567/02]
MASAVFSRKISTSPQKVSLFPPINGLDIAFLIHKRYIPDPEQLNQQRFKCAAQMREPL